MRTNAAIWERLESWRLQFSTPLLVGQLAGFEKNSILSLLPCAYWPGFCLIQMTIEAWVSDMGHKNQNSGWTQYWMGFSLVWITMVIFSFLFTAGVKTPFTLHELLALFLLIAIPPSVIFCIGVTASWMHKSQNRN